MNTSTTQKASDMTPEIRFNIVYAQDAEVCLLNDMENMVISIDAQLSQMNIHFKQGRIISIIKFLFHTRNNGGKSETKEITIEDSCLSF